MDHDILSYKYAGSPWYFFGPPDTDKNCYHDLPKAVTEKTVPEACKACWKVSIRPQTIMQLLDLFLIFRNSKFHCKCGADLRHYTYGAWGGYIYCRSKEEGLEVINKLKPSLETLGAISLKRGCTEIEHYIHPIHWGAGSLELPRNSNTKPQNEDAILMFWLVHSIGIGDPKAKEAAKRLGVDWSNLVMRTHNYMED